MVRPMVFLKILTILTLIFTFSSKGWSDVDLQRTQKLNLPQDISEPLISSETSKKIQPKSVGAGESGSSVISKIADNSLALIWDSSNLKRTAVGQVVEKAEKNLKTEMTFTDNSANKTQHKFCFKILAMQALAKLEYKGWLNAAINYDAKASKTEAEVSEKIFNRQDIVISHVMLPEESKSQVALRWSW